MKKVGIIMGSDSDLPVVEKAIDTLKSFGVTPEVHVYSAHRTPAEALSFARNAGRTASGVIIAAAGKAAHLAGALAANTTLPVIGLPVSSHTLDGIDALLSTVQMPSGIPVATVAIDGAVNAALLSIEMLAIADETLAAKLQAKRDADTAAVLSKNAAVEARFNGVSGRTASIAPYRCGEIGIVRVGAHCICALTSQQQPPEPRSQRTRFRADI